PGQELMIRESLISRHGSSTQILSSAQLLGHAGAASGLVSVVETCLRLEDTATPQATVTVSSLAGQCWHILLSGSASVGSPDESVGTPNYERGPKVIIPVRAVPFSDNVPRATPPSPPLARAGTGPASARGSKRPEPKFETSIGPEWFIDESEATSAIPDFIAT